jgi:O-antigen/teichoic acid export membrane protein
MSKAADMAKVSAKGSFHLLWGIVISTIISSVGTIFIANFLGSDLYGLYAIVLTAPNLIIIFRDWGVNSAMTRSTAQYRAEGKNTQIRSIFISGLIFEIALGLTLSIICLILSGFLAGTLFNRPTIAPLIQIASISILAGGLINTATAAFTGMEKMELNSIMLICQSIIKTLLILFLVSPIIGLGTQGATIGYSLAFLIAGIIGVLLMWTMYAKLPKPETQKPSIKTNIKEMFKYGMPLSLSSIISGFQAQFYAFLLPIYYIIDNSIIGNYLVAANFVVLINFFAIPIQTMLFPAFSKLDPQKDKEALRNVFQFSIKYASLLVIPATAIVMALSQPAVQTLFPNKYDSAPLFLALLAVTYLYTAFGSLSTGNLINSQGQTKYNLKLTILAAAIGFPMSYILTMTFGILGLIATTLTVGIPGLALSLRFIKKHYDVTVDWKSSARILLSSTIAAAAAYIVLPLLPFASWIQLILGLIVFAVVLIPTALLTKTITPSDIRNLRDMTSGLGPLKGILNYLLNIIEKMMNLLRL